MGTRRADAALCAQLGRLPNGEIDGFGQVFGKIECLTLHRSGKKEWSENGYLCGRKGGAGRTDHTATWAMATATVMVAMAVGARVLVSGTVGAKCLHLVFGTTGFFGRFLSAFRRHVAATGPSAVRRQGEQAEEEEQCGETVFHKFRVRR